MNADAVLYIAMAAKKASATLVHYSTDYVFDGRNINGYKEDALKNPVNIYGASKSKGEDSITSNYSKFYLIRTAWLYGKSGKNFVYKIIELASSKPMLKVVNDQFGSPTYAKDLALATKEIISSKMPFGIYHVTNSGSCSWHEFASEILKQKSLSTPIEPCSSSEFPRPAKRPSCSVMLNTKLKPLRHWKSALKAFMEEIS